jgi:hypothetical protein
LIHVKAGDGAAANTRRPPKKKTTSGMTDDREAWQSARNMLARYGEDALRQTDLRIRELEQLGETRACTAWQEIRRAVQALMDSGRQEPKH